MAHSVSYENFIARNVGGSDPIQQTLKKQGGDINYNEIKLHYNYGTDNEPIIDDLFLELPETTASGIMAKEEDAMGQNGPYKKKSHSVMIKFDLSNQQNKPQYELALQKLDEVHAACCYLLGSCKGKVKMHDFDATRPGGMFKSPVYWPRDDNTGEKIKGKNPNLWVKLRAWKNSKALFTDVNGKAVSWDLLTDVDITFVPLIHIEKIYIGSKASLQISLASAIITRVVPLGTQTRQGSTLEKLKSKYGDGLAQSVEAQLAELRLARQEQTQVTSNEFGSVNVLGNSNVGSTSFGGNNNSGINSGSMHRLQDSGSNEHQPTSIQDFLAGAPSMQSTPQAFAMPNTNPAIPAVPSMNPVSASSVPTQNLGVRTLKLN
jgi:hypothetical protein